MEADQNTLKIFEPMHALPELSVEDVRKLLVKPKTLTQIVEVVQELMISSVCVIWKPSRTVGKLAGDSHPRGRLYPFSSTYPKDHNAYHAGILLDLEHDSTGQFYLSQKHCAFVNDFPACDTQSPSREFMDKANLKHVCMARFKMNGTRELGMENYEVEYAVSVYRRAEQPEYSQIEAERLQRIAWFLPSLYRQMMDSELKNAIIKVNQLLRPKYQSIEKARQQLYKLCPALATFFHCYEVTIYLREPYSSTDEFMLLATTLDPNRIMEKQTPDKHGGLTNYVLATGKTIWFNDLNNFNNPSVLKIIRQKYPDITWADGAKLGREAKHILGLPEAAPNPPLPFIATPIFGTDDEESKPKEILGVIRACLGKHPFYFIEDEVSAFEIVAQEIGRWWKSFGHGLEQAKRADIWESLNKTLRAQHEVLRYIDDESDISVPLAQDTISSLANEPSFGMAVFRRGHDKNQLRLLAKAKKSQNLDTPLNTIIPFGGELNLPEKNRGFHIEIIERNAPKIERSGSIEEQKLFAGMAMVLSMAVMIGKKLYGVLDVGFLNESHFRLGEERIRQFLELTARQLALFERVRTSVEAVKTAQANEFQTYAAVTHQLRGPLLTATKRLRFLINRLGGSTNPEIITLATVAGMVRKAHGVATTIQMLGSFIKNDPVKVPIGVASADALRKLTLEICHNYRLLSPEEMKLQFILEPALTWGEAVLKWNKSCAENSLDAIISNAFKYSNPGELIQINGRLEGAFFAVQIISRGITLQSKDIENCTKYEWRGEEAKKQDGAGIGLWITNHYMRVQDGKLRIHPTNRNGETMFELLFPIRGPGN